LGHCYAKGQGVAADINEALRWFQLAADQGHAEAQKNLRYYAARAKKFAKDRFREAHLNRAIFTYVLLDVLAFGWFRGVWQGAVPLFAVIPLVLGVWAILVVWHRFRLKQESQSPSYLTLASGDYWRWFFIVWAGWTPFATAYKAGFLVAAAVVVVSVIIAIVVIIRELRRKFSPLILGMCVLMYSFLGLLRTGYSQHYGVPIIGHFFERPEYSARYMVAASPVMGDLERADAETRMVAEIRVEGSAEADDIGEDRIGQTITSTSYSRDVWVQRLHLSSSESVTITEQEDPLSLGGSVFVTDSQGGIWFVKLLNEPVP
jgi:hypothetical protein